MLEQLRIVHARRAGRLAREATETKIHFITECLRGLKLPIGNRSHQRDPAARTVTLHLREIVSRAGRWAGTARSACIAARRNSRGLLNASGAWRSAQHSFGFQRREINCGNLPKRFHGPTCRHELMKPFLMAALHQNHFIGVSIEESPSTLSNKAGGGDSNL